MTGSTGSPPRGRRKVKFTIIASALLLGLGFFGGVSATKRAIFGPPWIQRIFGIELPVQDAPVVVAPRPAPPAPVVPAPTAPAPAAADAPPAAGAPVRDTQPSAPPASADPNGFLGRWEITDDVQTGGGAPTQVVSGYVFNADGTGEFDTNGKKLYGLHWVLSGEFLTVTYDNELAPGGGDGALRMRWSVTPDKSLLTLAPENGKDARETLYSVGPGVLHRK